jgi:hypothetical protein
MSDYRIHYGTVKALGFKEEEAEDEVYFNQFGYPCKIITLDLQPCVYVQWHQDTQRCDLVRLKDEKSGDILLQTELTARAFCDVINYFSGGKRLVNWDGCKKELTIDKPWQ